jgi:putative phosphoribosyl transferase
MSQTTSATEHEYEVTVPAGERRLEGILSVPAQARGAVLFAHGSGSGRHSPRNQYVARVLQQASLATLLIDLLEEDEATDRRRFFDIELLASRLLSATEWLSNHPDTSALRLGYFGASTGAGAALVAAAQQPDKVAAIVSRGGRPDLAGASLRHVKAPTLLIVGGNDDIVLELNERAFKQLRCTKKLVVIPRATHLFEEPGALEEVSRLAQAWFVQYLAA